MKGSSLIKLMKSLSKENNFYNIIFVSYTAFDSYEKKKYILDQGADYILNKPVVYQDLRNLINDILIDMNL